MAIVMEDQYQHCDSQNQTLCMLGFLLYADFFQNELFLKFFQEHH